MHPPERGFGKRPRQQPDGAENGRRPLLQGHLKPVKGRKATKPAPEAAVPEAPRVEPPKVPEEG